MEHIVKQGIEVESHIRPMQYLKRCEDNPNNLPSPYCSDYNTTPNFMPENFPGMVGDLLYGMLYKAPHWDTNRCTEIDTLPFCNLGELSDNLKEMMSRVIDYCNRKDYLIMFAGSVPVSWIAGGHIHCSSNKLDIFEVRDILYYYQPFIYLLGQNSSFYKDTQLAMDKRLELSTLRDSRETLYKIGFSRFGQNCQLSPDTDMFTCEVRQPSSASLIQAIGTATFLKACIFCTPPQSQLLDNELLSLSSVIVSNGGKTFLRLGTSQPKSQEVSIGKLFKILLYSANFAESLDKALGELSTNMANKVKKFYSIFFDGHTMTDYYDSVCERKSLVDQCQALHDIGELEYLRESSLISNAKPVDKTLTERTGTFIHPRYFNIENKDFEVLMENT